MKKTKVTPFEKLTPEEQQRQTALVEKILDELKNETPAQAAARESGYAAMFYNLPDEKFWEYNYDGRHWEEAMTSRVKVGTITQEEVVSWFGTHPVSPFVLEGFSSTHCLGGFGGITDGLSKAQVKRILWALRTGVPTKRWITLKPSKISRCRCHECGQLPNWQTNGVTIRQNPNAPACPHPNGFKGFTTELRVPSGKLAISDYHSALDVAPERDPYDHSHQQEYGRVTDYNAKHQQFATMGFCGNSCPSFFGSDDKARFMVANPVWDDNYSDQKIIASPMPEGQRVGGICTDAWEYALADYDYLKSMGGGEDRCDGIIEVKPGVYRVTHHGHYINRDDFKNPRVFAELEWIRDC